MLCGEKFRCLREARFELRFQPLRFSVGFRGRDPWTAIRRQRGHQRLCVLCHSCESISDFLGAIVNAGCGAHTSRDSGSVRRPIAATLRGKAKSQLPSMALVGAVYSRPQLSFDPMPRPLQAPFLMRWVDHGKYRTDLIN